MERPPRQKGKGKRGWTRFERHFHLTTAPHARMNETKRSSAYEGACLKAISLPPTSDISYMIGSVISSGIFAQSCVHMALKNNASHDTSAQIGCSRATGRSNRHLCSHWVIKLPTPEQLRTKICRSGTTSPRNHCAQTFESNTAILSSDLLLFPSK